KTGSGWWICSCASAPKATPCQELSGVGTACIALTAQGTQVSALVAATIPIKRRRETGVEVMANTWDQEDKRFKAVRLHRRCSSPACRQSEPIGRHVVAGSPWRPAPG